MASKAGEKRSATSALGRAQKRARQEKVDDQQQPLEIRHSPQRDAFLPASFFGVGAQAADSAWDRWVDEPLPEEPPMPDLSAREQELVRCKSASPAKSPIPKLVVREHHQVAAVGWEELPPEVQHHIVAMMDAISRSYFVSASKATYADVTAIRDIMGPAFDNRFDEFQRLRPGVESEQNETAALIESLTRRALPLQQWEAHGVDMGTQYRYIGFPNNNLIPESFFNGLGKATHWKTLTLTLWTDASACSEVAWKALRSVFAQGSVGLPGSPRALNVNFPGSPLPPRTLCLCEKDDTQSQVLALMRNFGGPDSLLRLTGLSTIAFPGLEQALQFSRSIRRLQVLPGDALDFKKLRSVCPGLEWFSYKPQSAVDPAEFDAFCEHHPALESVLMWGNIDIPFHFLRSPRLHVHGQRSEVEAGNLVRRLGSPDPLTHLVLMQVPLSKSLAEAIAGNVHLKTLLSFYWGPPEEIEICRQLLVKLADHPNLEVLKLSRWDDGRVSAQLDELRAKNPRIQIEYVDEAHMDAWDRCTKL